MFLFSSCGTKQEEDDNVLLRYEGQTLTYDEVVSKIPQGILPGDSAALFNSIVDAWVKDVVLSEFAEKRLLDINSIDLLVKEYRNTLIVQEYLNRMREAHPAKPDDLKIKDYYDKHRKELKLEVPLVKGIFLKINSESKGKDNIRNLMASENTENIDKLESEWLDKALEYNYFRDKWIDWETVSSKIPYRFGNAEKFLEENKFFETDYDDCSYYLQISDYLRVGEEQPFEFAASWISNLLTRGELAEYERSLVESIVKESIKDNKLEAIGYDPIKHEIKEKNVILDNE